MKLILQVAAGVLLAGLIGWMSVDFTSFRHTFFGYNQQEIDDAWDNVHHHEEVLLGGPLNEASPVREPQPAPIQNFAHKLKAVEIMHGKYTAKVYEDCHSSTAKTKKQELQCKRLEAMIKRDD